MLRVGPCCPTPSLTLATSPGCEPAYSTRIRRVDFRPPCGIIKVMSTVHSFQTDDARLGPFTTRLWPASGSSADDALALYRTGDILAVGWMANYVRERMHGDKTYFNVNRHINPTNVCVAACRLCAFGRKKDTPGAYTMALEEAFETAASGYTEAVTEFHIVGGLHPDLPFQYFLDLISGLKQRFPQVHLKAFTMVEVAYLSKRAKLSIRETLEQLKAAGVDSLPGGGAEIFADRVRHIICDHKIDGDQWLDTAKLAHQIGLKSNATMLYGHVENDEDRVDHLLKLRALQDETHGFQTFIPLAFHPDNTPLQHLPKTSGMLDIKQIAVSRLVLDNFPHIKAYWQMMTPKIAQIALALRRRRHRRHRHRRKDLPRRRRHHSARHAPRGSGAPDPRSGQGTGGARHAVPAGDADGDVGHRRPCRQRRLPLLAIIQRQHEAYKSRSPELHFAILKSYSFALRGCRIRLVRTTKLHGTRYPCSEAWHECPHQL